MFDYSINNFLALVLVKVTSDVTYSVSLHLLAGYVDNHGLQRINPRPSLIYLMPWGRHFILFWNISALPRNLVTDQSCQKASCWSSTVSHPPLDRLPTCLLWWASPERRRICFLNKAPAVVDHFWLCSPRSDGCDAVLLIRPLSSITQCIHGRAISTKWISQGVWYSL